VGPESAVIETGDLIEGIIAAAMGIAGKLAQGFQFAEDGEVHIRLQGALEISKTRDRVTPQISSYGLGIVNRWPHNVRIPTQRRDESEF